MAKKKSVGKKDLISYYMDWVLEHGKEPPTVYALAKEMNFDEAIFYKYYGSFESLRKDIFAQFFVNTLEMLEKSDDYASYEARNKLLSFYFTFFEMLTSNRSYVVYALNDKKNKLKQLSDLAELRKHFKHYISSLDIETIDLKQERLEKIKEKSIQETAWLQLVITMKFWLDDESAGFEKTDIFIEKAVNTSFDLINTQPLMSLLDLGKFIVKEKVHMN